MTPLFFQAGKNPSSSKRVVYIDRDGVLMSPILRGGEISSARKSNEILICDDAIKLCVALKGLGYTLVVVSNQPDLSRGLIDVEFLKIANQAISKSVDIDYFIYCPHQEIERCDCRKPKSGMIELFRAHNPHSLMEETMIGDRVVDYDCALVAKIPFLLKLQPYSYEGDGARLIDIVPSFENLKDALAFFEPNGT